MTIAEFLQARIAEDEAALERTGPFPHSTHAADVVGTYREDCPDCIGMPSRARVLAECAAKRSILKHCERLEDKCLDMNAWNVSEYDDILECLAAVYAGHPDYQQEWAA